MVTRISYSSLSATVVVVGAVDLVDHLLASHHCCLLLAYWHLFLLLLLLVLSGLSLR